MLKDIPQYLMSGPLMVNIFLPTIKKDPKQHSFDYSPQLPHGTTLMVIQITKTHDQTP